MEQNTSEFVPLSLACDHGVGSKGQMSLNFNYKVNFKGLFLQTFVCVLTNKGYKMYQSEFSFPCLGHAPRWDLGCCVVKILSVRI